MLSHIPDAFGGTWEQSLEVIKKRFPDLRLNEYRLAPCDCGKLDCCSVTFEVHGKQATCLRYYSGFNFPVVQIEKTSEPSNSDIEIEYIRIAEYTDPLVAKAEEALNLLDDWNPAKPEDISPNNWTQPQETKKMMDVDHYEAEISRLESRIKGERLSFIVCFALSIATTILITALCCLPDRHYQVNGGRPLTKEEHDLVIEKLDLQANLENYRKAWQHVVDRNKELETALQRPIQLDGKTLTSETPIALAESQYESELEVCERIASSAYARANWGEGVRTEVTLNDGSRVDLLSQDYAIEADWAKSKWKEAIGQAIYYSIWTEKKPGILLLTKSDEDSKNDILRCKMVCEKLGIKLWVVAAQKKSVEPDSQANAKPASQWPTARYAQGYVAPHQLP